MDADRVSRESRNKNTKNVYKSAEEKRIYKEKKLNEIRRPEANEKLCSSFISLYQTKVNGYSRKKDYYLNLGYHF